MKDREFKGAIYNGLAKLLKALANPFRLQIVEMLSQGEKSVESMVQSTELTTANASQHLQVLKNSNIVKSRKEKQYVYYSLINDDFLALYQEIIKYAVSEIAELEKTLNQQRKNNKALNAVSLEELQTQYQNNDIILLDVRPTIEYQLGHITGAISMPINELLGNLNNLSRDKEIIAYCRGPFCVLADEAVRALHKKGFKVRRLDKGYPEWKIKHLHKNNL